MQEGKKKKDLLIFIIIYLFNLAFVDSSSRPPTRKKRATPSENPEESYVDVKVFIYNKKVFQI